MKLSLLFTLMIICIEVIAQPTKFMTYNIRYANPGDNENRWDNRKEKVVNLIEHYNPDIFGIQEGLLSQVAYLDQQLTNFNYVGVGRDDGKQQGEYCAIFYNSKEYKMIQHATFWLSPTPEEISVGWDAAMERICTYGLFQHQSTGKNVWILNTHFDHQGKEARAQSAALIIKKMKSIVAKQPAPLVLMGDFNASDDEAPIVLIQEWIEDARIIAKSLAYGPVGTFNGFDTNKIMDRRIDYLFLKGFDEVNKCLHIDDRRDNNLYPSDHLPVLVEATW